MIAINNKSILALVERRWGRGKLNQNPPLPLNKTDLRTTIRKTHKNDEISLCTTYKGLGIIHGYFNYR